MSGVRPSVCVPRSHPQSGPAHSSKPTAAGLLQTWNRVIGSPGQWVIWVIFHFRITGTAVRKLQALQCCRRIGPAYAATAHSPVYESSFTASKDEYETSPSPRHQSSRDCVTVRSMVNIARLTIWSIYCSRGGGEGRADPSIVAPFIGAA